MDFSLGIEIGWLPRGWVDRGTQVDPPSPDCGYACLPCLHPQWAQSHLGAGDGAHVCPNACQASQLRLALGAGSFGRAECGAPPDS